MPIYKPSPDMMYNTVNSNSLPLSITVLVVGVLSQVEATIELTNRICDRYLQPVCPYAGLKDGSFGGKPDRPPLRSTTFIPALS